MNTVSVSKLMALMALIVAAGLLAGCTLEMNDQPRYDPLEASTFFPDHASARPRVEDTVTRDHLKLDPQLYTGRVDGRLTESFPFTVTLEVLERGQERFDIYCTPCHGLLGDGRGVTASYGFEAASFQTQAMREEPAGFYFETMTDGTRVMPSYATRIAPEDRWAIVAYIRALQLSQNAAPEQVPADLLPRPGQKDTITP